MSYISGQETNDTPSLSENPLWLEKLSILIANIDPADLWEVYVRTRRYWTPAEEESDSVRVVFSEDPKIFAEVESGIWSLVCVFDPDEAKKRRDTGKS